MRAKSPLALILCIAMIGSSILGGCVKPKEIYTSEGLKGQVIDCGAVGRGIGQAMREAGGNQAPTAVPVNWTRCFTQAGEICGTRGYDVLERNPNCSMVIQCKGQ